MILCVHTFSIIHLASSVLIDILVLNAMNMVKASCFKYLNTNIEETVSTSYHLSPKVTGGYLKLTSSTQGPFPHRGRKTLASASLEWAVLKFVSVEQIMCSLCV